MISKQESKCNLFSTRSLSGLCDVFDAQKHALGGGQQRGMHGAGGGGGQIPCTCLLPASWTLDNDFYTGFSLDSL